MKIPQILFDNIAACYGEQGKAWLNDLSRIITACENRWQLDSLKPVKDISYNYVCTAHSRIFGDVVLKLGFSAKELEAEYRALSLLGPDCACVCYSFDKELVALVLERIEPGQDLYSIDDFYKQIDTGSDMIKNCGCLAPEPVDGIPQFSAWLNKAVKDMRAGGKADDKFESLLKRSLIYYSELDALDTPYMILHGDLHHQNILLDKNGGCRVIDPKGVRARQIFEVGRFVRNQLWVIAENEHHKYLEYMLARFAELFSLPEKTIAKSVFVDSILSGCWTLTGFLSDEDFQREYEKVMKESSLFFEYSG